MLGGRDGVLVFVGGAGGNCRCKGVGKPVGGADEGCFCVDVLGFGRLLGDLLWKRLIGGRIAYICALLLACAECAFVQSGRCAVS